MSLPRGSSWRPTANLEALKARAQLLRDLRSFFLEHQVMEVETPLLSRATVTDVHLESFRVESAEGWRYLQTSPEYAMKRLLSAYAVPIYQISKAFRSSESGRHHNPEFSLLEWYRPGFSLAEFMDEMDLLLSTILQTEKARRCTYADLFQEAFSLDPHRADLAEIIQSCRDHTIHRGEIEDRDSLLQLLFAHGIEDHLGRENRPTFVHDWPVSQAALARVRPGDPSVAERFEVYLSGVELANGFHELRDAEEQRARFENDRSKRRLRELDDVAVDERLLAALEHGLPSCCGVALGVDRLLVLRLGADSLSEVLAFPWSRA